MKRWVWVIPLFLAFISHAPALQGDFVWDDAIVTKSQVLAFKTVGDVFFPPENIPQWAQNYYRPVIVISYLVDQQFFGPDARVGPHLTNLFFHLSVTLFVYLLSLLCFRNLRHREWGACVAACVFAVHPIHTESVSWITGRSDTVAAFFMVPSLVAAIAYRDRGALWQLILAPVLFLLAILSKEVALSALLVLPPLLWLVPKRDALKAASPPQAETRPPSRKSRKKRKGAKGEAKQAAEGAVKKGSPVLLYLFFVLAAIIYFVLRQKAHTGYGSAWLPGFGEILGRSWCTAGYYVLKTVIPYPQLHFVPAGYLPGVQTASLVLIAAFAAFGIGMKYWHAGRALLVISLVWFLATLSPSLIVAVRSISETPVAERYLYLPSISLALILGGLACFALEKRYRRVTVAVTLFILAGYGILTGLRAAVWTDNIRLWSDATSKAPDHCLPWNELAEAHYKAGDQDESLRCLETGIQADCDAEGRSIIYNNMGTLFGHQGVWEKAGPQFEAAVRERPSYASPHYGLGSVALMKSTQAESVEEARQYAEEGVKHFERAVQLNPLYTKAMWGLIRCHTTLGRLAEQVGDATGAVEEYEAAQRHFLEMIRTDRRFALSNRVRAQALEEIKKRLAALKEAP